MPTRPALHKPRKSKKAPSAYDLKVRAAVSKARQEIKARAKATKTATKEAS
jgi:hypothetical protein